MTSLLLALLLAAGTAPAASPTPAPATSAPAVAPAGDKPDLRSVLEHMQRRYDQAKDLRARFSQNYTRGVVGRSTLSTGTLTFKKPGRMRWEYATPAGKLFLLDGTFGWFYKTGVEVVFLPVTYRVIAWVKRREPA